MEIMQAIEPAQISLDETTVILPAILHIQPTLTTVIVDKVRIALTILIVLLVLHKVQLQVQEAIVVTLLPVLIPQVRVQVAVDLQAEVVEAADPQEAEEEAAEVNL
jgi:hypothetical protein